MSIGEDLWLKFLDAAIGGLREAHKRMISGERQADLESRPGWFGRPRRSGGGLRYPEEEAISQALWETLDELQAEQLVTGSSTFAYDLTRMEFGLEVPRARDRRIGRRALPTDLRIRVIQNRLDLRLEAKNVIRAGDLNAEYVGSRGLARFDDPIAPYTTERFGAMIAYVMDEQEATWRGKVRTCLVTARGAAAVTEMPIGNDRITTTIHDRLVDDRDQVVRYRTDVLHLVLCFRPGTGGN